MRTLTTMLPALALLAGCHAQPQANEEELEDFRPPTVQLRGDVMPRQEVRFTRLDANRDGVLSADEFPKRNPGRIAAFDGDKDGRVSKSELVAGALRRFDAQDTNHDGQVTPEERAAQQR